MSDSIVDMDALTRLFGDEFEFDIQPGARAAGVILRGELIATILISSQLYPGDLLTLNLGGRVYKFRVPRWSIKLRLEPLT